MLIFASDFGSIAIMELALGILGVSLLVSVLSLAFAIPTKLRKSGHWHSRLAVVASSVGLLITFYLNSTVQAVSDMEWSTAIYWAPFCAPLICAIFSWILTRQKKA